MIKISTIYIVLISLAFSSYLHAQTWSNIQQLGSDGGESCQALTIDYQNNIYLSGGFNSNFPIGNQTLIPVGDIDIYLTKLDKNGNVKWVVSGGSSEDDEVVEVAVDDDNNVYWAGMYWLNADFGDTMLSVESSSRAIFIIKYTENGQLIWAKSFDGTGLKQLSDLTIGTDNNLYFTGYFKDTLTLDDLSLVATADTDIFVAKMTTEGDIIWGNRAGLDGENLGISLVTDEENNVFVGGHYQGKIAFQTDTIQSNTPDFDVFIAKFDANGDAIWGRKAGGVFPSELSQIAIDEANNIYVTGTFLGVLRLSDDIELQTDGFNKNIYLLKYNQNGLPIWAKSIGGTSDEQANDMVLNQQTIAIIGNFMDNMLLDNFSITSNSNLFNGFTAGFSLNGETKWLEKMASSNLLLAEKIAINQESEVLTAGIFMATATFNDLNYPSNGSFDIFLATLNQQITSIPFVEIAEPRFHFFPNPASHSIFINTELEDFTISLCHKNGQIIKTYNSPKLINISELSSGIYCLKIASETFNFTKTLVVF